MDSTRGVTAQVIADTWDMYVTDWANRKYFRPMVPSISSFLIENGCSGSLLDLGSGNGAKSKFFKEIGFEVTGIDGSPSKIKGAKANYPEINFIEFQIGSELPFEDDSFDVVFSCSVFQYIKHPEMLQECRRILKKDGHLILIENLKNNPITLLGRGYLKLKKHTYETYPWNHFTLKEIHKISGEFNQPSFSVYHLLSPLAFLKPLRGLQPFLHKIDTWLLRTRITRSLAWLILFTAKNKKTTHAFQKKTLPNQRI